MRDLSLKLRIERVNAAREVPPVAAATAVTRYGANVEIMTGAGPAHVVLDKSARQPPFLVVLTHGAGGRPDTPDVLAVRDPALAGSGWAVTDWEPVPGFTAAVAVETTGLVRVCEAVGP